MHLLVKNHVQNRTKNFYAKIRNLTPNPKYINFLRTIVVSIVEYYTQQHFRTDIIFRSLFFVLMKVKAMYK